MAPESESVASQAVWAAEGECERGEAGKARGPGGAGLQDLAVPSALLPGTHTAATCARGSRGHVAGHETAERWRVLRRLSRRVARCVRDGQCRRGAGEEQPTSVHRLSTPLSKGRRAREPRDGAALLYILVCLRSAFGVPREGTMPLQYTAERVSRATEPPCCRRQQPVSATDKSDRERPQASFTIIGLTDPGQFHPGPASVPVPCQQLAMVTCRGPPGVTRGHSESP